MTCTSEYGRVTDLKEQENWDRGPADLGRPRPQARSDVVPLHAFRTPEDNMIATTDHYVGIDLHKRQAQVAVLEKEGEVVEAVRVENANLDNLAQRYAGAQAAIEATSNYYHIQDTLSEHLDMNIPHPKELNQIASSDKKTDRVDAKELARMARLNSVLESYVLTDEIWEAPALVRGRQTLVENRIAIVGQSGNRETLAASV